MKRFFVSTAAILAASAMAQAQPQAGQSGASALQCADSLILDAVEIVATRVNGNSPVAHTDISADQIRRNNYGYDIPALLSLTPSVISTTETGIGVGGTSIRMRGTDATRLNVTINGVSLNDPDSHAMYWYDTPDLISSVGDMQVQRGAGTSTNGSGAFGGAISMTTAGLSTEYGADASLSYGSFNTNKQAVHVGSGLLKDHWIMDFRLTHIGSDGYIDRASTDMESYMFQAGWLGRSSRVKFVSFGGLAKTYLTYNGTTLEDIKAYGRRYHTSGQYEDPDGKFVLADGTKVSYFDDQTDNYRQCNNQIIFNHSFNGNFCINVTGFYTYGYGFYRQYKDDAWLSGYNNLVDTWDQADLIRKKKMSNNRYGINATGIFKTSTLEMTAGGSWSLYGGPHWGTIDWIDGQQEELYKGFRWYENNVRKIDANVFWKADWNPAKGLDIFADVQYRLVDYSIQGTNDNYDWNLNKMQPVNVDNTWNFVNPHIGARYSFCKKHSIFAAFGMTSKEPTRSDFTDRYNFSSLKTEPVPERLMDTEAGYNYNGKSVDFGLNLYYMKYKDQLVPTGIVNDSEDNLNINVPDSYRKGIELTCTARVCEWLSILASGTFSRNRIKDYSENINGIDWYLGETTIAYSPSVIASGALDFHKNGWEALLRTQYVSKQYLTNGNFDDLSLDSYSVTDLDLAYTLKCRKVCKDVRFGVKVGNLFNAKYFSYGYGGSWLNGETLDTRDSWAYFFPQACTNVLANISLKF